MYKSKYGNGIEMCVISAPPSARTARRGASDGLTRLSATHVHAAAALRGQEGDTDVRVLRHLVLRSATLSFYYKLMRMRKRMRTPSRSESFSRSEFCEL